MLEKVIYTVESIAGDYAVLLSQDGVENRVAMALLPWGIDTGDRLKWENFEYEIVAPCSGTTGDH